MGNSLLLPRRWIYRVHGWLGLGTGLFLLALGLSGSILVFRHELDRWLNPHLWQVEPTEQRLGADLLAQRAHEALPEYHLFNLRPPEFPGDVCLVHMRQRTEGHDVRRAEVFLNPHTGQILGSRQQTGSFTGWIYRFHLNFFGGTPGHIIVALLGVALVVTGVSGLLVLQRPWRAPAGLGDMRGQSTRLTLSRLHRLVGWWALAFNVVSGITGAWFNLPTLPQFFSPLPQPTGCSFNQIENGPNLEQLWTSAIKEFRGFVPHSFAFPRREGEAIKVRGSMRGDWFWSRTSSYVLFDPKTGAHVGSRDINTAGWQDKCVAALGPLHFGNYGGVTVKLIYSAGGLTPGILCLTGLFIWLKRSRHHADGTEVGANAGFKS